MDFKLKVIKIEELHLIKELWEKLNQLHMKDSKFFKEHYATFTFQKRCEKFRTMTDKDIRVAVIEKDDLEIIGYCISTVHKEVGEIESLFIEEAYRYQGLGNLLVNEAIDWLKEKNCKKFCVAVADGHESVFDFYRKHGFYPRLTYLELK
ncbi:GNAT family N-acetyltransferase [Clostridium formicaceticum]|uniref:Protease synthase and sporulation negative regulatory protein PAI 1 n=1 Tax=Clostridium formicaceticum TaxID=1497 RepID=A0AAC9WGP8_9CLOT|nr:GNAT family N-acetyltransferase [Clostridium formicaceticum]AOY77589.1 hypothetical protein BJL90_18040 [Clostridium formicaceticum]ARE88168.1 Protease synthase and sporulation negative regulatory protein PAI 1 [Clostridium formicaceticum]